MFKVRIALFWNAYDFIKKNYASKSWDRGNKSLKRLRNNKETIYPTETASDTKRDDVEHS